MPENTLNEFYPPITDILTISDLPENIDFLNDLDFLSKIYYKNYLHSFSRDGSGAFYSLDVLCRKRLSIAIPGTGLSLILNADYNENDFSSFPITIFWKWNILKYINNFNATKFSFSPQDLFALALQIFQVDNVRLLEIAANQLLPSSGVFFSRFEKIESDINTLYGLDLDIDFVAETKYEQLSSAIELSGHSVSDTVFVLYVLNDPEESLRSVFAAYLQDGLTDYIQELIVPDARISVSLNAAIEFPRSALLPMIQTSDGLKPNDALDSSGNLLKSYFEFANADIDFDLKTGFGFSTDFSGSLIPQYNQIGGTGLIISFSNAKLDLSCTSNIPEADAAGFLWTLLVCMFRTPPLVSTD